MRVPDGKKFWASLRRKVMLDKMLFGLACEAVAVTLSGAAKSDGAPSMSGASSQNATRYQNQITMRRTLILMATAFALIAAMAPRPLLADAPGSYSLSCKDIGYIDKKMIATCRRADGSWVESILVDTPDAVLS